MHEVTLNTTNAAHAIARASQELQRRYASQAGYPGPDAITAGHQAVNEIDTALRHLYAARSALVTELRRDADATMARVDKLLGRES